LGHLDARVDVGVADRDAGAVGGHGAAGVVVLGTDRHGVGVGGPVVGHRQQLGDAEGDGLARGEHGAAAVGRLEGVQQVAHLVVGQAPYGGRFGPGRACVGVLVGVPPPLVVYALSLHGALPISLGHLDARVDVGVADRDAGAVGGHGAAGVVVLGTDRH